MKTRHAVSPLVFSFASEYADMKVKKKMIEIEGTGQLLVYTDDKLLGKQISQRETC
jgi:hypothetical protein